MRLRVLFEKSSTVRIIRAAETQAVPSAHVDMHGFSAHRAGRTLPRLQAAGELQAELAAADLAEIALPAVHRLAIAIDGIRLAARTPDSLDQFPLHLSMPCRARYNGGARPLDTSIVGRMAILQFSIFNNEGTALAGC